MPHLVTDLAHRSGMALKRLLWGSATTRLTTVGAGVGFIVALALPGFGLAGAFGGIAGWLVAIPLLTFVGGMIGNRLGIGHEHRALKRKLGAESK